MTDNPLRPPPIEDSAWFQHMITPIVVGDSLTIDEFVDQVRAWARKGIEIANDDGQAGDYFAGFIGCTNILLGRQHALVLPRRPRWWHRERPG